MCSYSIENISKSFGSSIQLRLNAKLNEEKVIIISLMLFIGKKWNKIKKASRIVLKYVCTSCEHKNYNEEKTINIRYKMRSLTSFPVSLLPES